MSKGVKSVTKSVKKVTKSVTKSVTKTVSKTVGGVLGLPSPEDQRKQAERMAKIQEDQAMQQQANAVEQARAQTMQMQTDADRQRILAEQQQNQTPYNTGSASVDVAPVATDASTRRKKFQTPQVGGTGSGDVSIRL